MTGAAAVLAEAGADLSLRDALAAALEANRRLVELTGKLREENARLRQDNARLLARVAERDVELDRVRADLAVLQRMLFGRSSERSRPGPAGGAEAGDAEAGGAEAGDAEAGDAEAGDAEAGDAEAGDAEAGGDGGRGNGPGVKRGPGARAGRRDYSHLPRFEVFWDFPGGGYGCPECGQPFTLLGEHVSGQQVDWQVIVRVVVHCRRRYRRACDCRVPATVMAPGPPKAIGKGLLSNGFIAMLLTERYVAGRSMNSLVTGLTRQGAEISPATLAGTCAQAGALLIPLAEAITARSRDSWHWHADETTWRVFAPREDSEGGQSGGSVRWWLWVFLGPDTVCFVMDPTRSGAVLARHAGIDEETGQLRPDADGGPRRLVISSDFYAVYSSAGHKADGLVNLYCWAHVRRHFVRAGDASPEQLKYWTDAWLERIKNLYTAHDELMAAWQDTPAQNPARPASRDKAADARLNEAHAAWDKAITMIDQARNKQMAAPGLAEPARKALATLDREWDGLAAHRNYPMISLDNNAAERMIRGPVVTRKNAGGSRNGDSARNAAVIWTVTATAQMAGLNVLTWLTAYLDQCGRNGGKPLTGPALERFLPWNASPGDLHAWATPPRPPG